PPGPPPASPNPGGASQPGKILTAAQQDRLNMSPAQRKRLEEIQKEIDSRLETLLTEDQKRQLQTMQQPPLAAGPGRGGPPGGQPLFRAYRDATNFAGLTGKDMNPGKTLEKLQKKEPEKKELEKKN